MEGKNQRPPQRQRGRRERGRKVRDTDEPERKRNRQRQGERDTHPETHTERHPKSPLHNWGNRDDSRASGEGAAAETPSRFWLLLQLGMARRGFAVIGFT